MSLSNIYIWICVRRCLSKNEHQKLCVTKNWIICLEYVNHFMFNNQHKWKRGENPYDQIMNMGISTLTMNIIHMYKLQKLGRKLIQLQFRFAHHLVLVMCFMAIWKKWPFRTHLPYVTQTQVSDIVWGHANILYGPNALIQAPWWSARVVLS